jgi:hypothetical protein
LCGISYYYMDLGSLFSHFNSRHANWESSNISEME